MQKRIEREFSSYYKIGYIFKNNDLLQYPKKYLQIINHLSQKINGTSSCIVPLLLLVKISNMEHVINNQPCDFTLLKGIVLDEKKATKTETTGYGGQNNSSIRISSVTTIKDTIFLQDENEKQHKISLVNLDIDCMKGHEMNVVYAGLKQNSYHSPIAVYNTTTNDLKIDTPAIENLARYPFSKILLFTVVPALLLGFKACSSTNSYEGGGYVAQHYGNEQNSGGVMGALFFGGIALFIAFALSKKLYKSTEVQKTKDIIKSTIQNG